MTTPPGRHAKSDPHPTASPPVAGGAAIPSDAAQQRIEDLLAALGQANDAYEALQRENEAIKQEIDLLRQELERYRRYVYGRRSERLDDPAQGHLFALGEDAEETEDLADARPDLPAATAPRKPRQSRKLDFSRLPQVRIEHDVPEAEKTCSCCGRPKTRIGEDERRELEFIPARFELRLHVLPKLHLSLSWTNERGEHGRARLAATAFVTARPSVVIRRHRLTEVTLEELVARQMFTPLLASFLRACVRAGKSIVVSGPQGAGKTTLIRALCACLDPSEKIGTFETEYELFLHEMPERHPIVHPWESRPGSSEVDAFGRRAGEFTLDEAIVDSFRFFLSRQIVGEVRGSEIWAMIKAMESGAGSISSTHGKDARATMAKLVTCAMESAASHDLAVAKLAQTVDVVVQIGLLTQPEGSEHYSRTRWISEIALVEPGDAGINLDHVFKADLGTTVATAAGTPIKQEMLAELNAQGFDVPGFQRELLARGAQAS
jgi:Flp pilus assembly CpaF family ATPase